MRGLIDAFGKFIPRQYGLDRVIRVHACQLCFYQCLADAGVQQDFFVDGLTLLMEPLLVFVFGRIKQAHEDAVVKIHYFIGHGRHPLDGKSYQSGVTPLIFESGQVARHHLTAFTRYLE